MRLRSNDRLRRRANRAIIRACNGKFVLPRHGADTENERFARSRQFLGSDDVAVHVAVDTGNGGVTGPHMR